MKKFKINSGLSFSDIQRIIEKGLQLEISAEAQEKINKCRSFLDSKMEKDTGPIYGINTGFGSLCNTMIGNDQLEELQKNLLISHACGFGDEVPQEIVKLMLLLKIQSLSYGHSGVHINTVQMLVDMFNNNILPVIYDQGSLGASGDLAPLAHLCLPLIGMGEVYFEGKKHPSLEILKRFNLEPVTLHSKAGLALINGTQFMSSYGVWCLLEAEKLITASDIIACLSLDAFDCRMEPFDDLIHAIRPHKGQRRTAKFIRQVLENSEMAAHIKVQVQDPYSFRCIPQVHGASKDAIEHVKDIFHTEVNSVTDNPNVFPDEDKIISGGNFHGQPLAISLDYLAIALSELGSISERRTYLLISGQRGLPPFLAPNPGLNSGFMIPQYTAASIVSQNKQLCTPASVDTILSSNGQEDHVSMGANAATKAHKVLKNLERILAVELFTAAQALEFRRPRKSSPCIEKLMEDYRRVVPFLDKDVFMHEEMMKTVEFIRTLGE